VLNKSSSHFLVYFHSTILPSSSRSTKLSVPLRYANQNALKPLRLSLAQTTVKEPARTA